MQILVLTFNSMYYTSYVNIYIYMYTCKCMHSFIHTVHSLYFPNSVKDSCLCDKSNFNTWSHYSNFNANNTNTTQNKIWQMNSIMYFIFFVYIQTSLYRSGRRGWNLDFSVTVDVAWVSGSVLALNT